LAADFVKHARTLSILTILSRAAGLARDMCLAAAFGTGVSITAFFVAFRLPNLFRAIFGEGALTAAFLPVYTKLVEDGDEAGARRLANLAVTVLVVVLAALTALGEVVILVLAWMAHRDPQFGDPRFNLTLGLSAVMLPFVISVCLVALLQGMLNVRGHFAAPALAPIVLNLMMIGAAGAALALWGGAEDVPPAAVFILAGSVLAAGVVEVLIQVPPLRRRGLSWRPVWDLASPHLRQIAVLMLPMVIGLGIVQFNVYMDSMVAMFFSPHPSPVDPHKLVESFEVLGRTIVYPLKANANSVMYYGQRLYQLPLGVFVVALGTAIFPALSRHAARQDGRGLAETLNHGLRVATAIALPCTAGLVIVAVPLVRLLFERGRFQPADTPDVALMTAAYGLGLVAYSVQHLVVRAFFARQETSTPAKTAVGAAAANFILNVTFIWFMGIQGLAISTVLCAAGQSVLLIWLLRRRIGRLGLRRYVSLLWRSSLATAAMSAAAWGAMRAVDLAGLAEESKIHAAALLASAVVVGGAVYVAAARLLKMDEFFEVFSRRAKVVREETP
jgi:putative peptidoglycan lipid II flippase